MAHGTWWLKTPLLSPKFRGGKFGGPAWLINDFLCRGSESFISINAMTRKKRVARTYFLSALWIQDPSPSKFLPYNGENLMYHFCKLAMCYYSYLKSIKGCAFESIPVLWKGMQIFARVEERNASSLWKGSLCQTEQQRTSITSELDIKTI